MTKENPSYISNANIKGGAERYENLLDEKQKILEDLKELSKELSSNGINMKALKEAIKIKRSPPNEDHESFVLGYLKTISAN